MENSEINLNRGKITEEEIRMDENFDAILKKHNQNLRGRKLKVGGMVLVVVFLVGMLSIPFVNGDKNIINQNVINNIVENGFKKPFDFDIEAKEFMVNNEFGDTLDFNNSKIIIPAFTFVDSNNNLINGKVKITYREFHNALDFLISGIPMSYDSAGYNYTFESAGMFEIKGFKDGKVVGLTKPIEVRLASFQDGDYFNKYYFDGSKNKWEYISKDNKTFDSSKNEDLVFTKNKLEIELKAVNKEIKSIEEKKPALKSKNGICIKIDVDSIEFPGLVNFKNILFEVDKSDVNFKPEMAKIEWDDIKLSKNDNVYSLIFFNNFEKTIIKSKPVYNNAEFARAMESFEIINKTKMENLKLKQKSLNNSIASFSNETSSASNLKKYIYRLFEVNKFGTYNSDCPRRMPKGQMIATLFTNQKEGSEKIDTLIFSTIYLVEENRNIMYNLSSTSNLSFNPNNKYVLWAVTDKQELAVFSAKKFKEIPRNHNGIYNFKMKISNKKIFTLEHVKKQLDIKSLFNDI